MSNITSKEYLKNLIIKGVKGEKIGQQESVALEKEMANFTVADWRNFKIAGKEAIKEEVDKFIDKDEVTPASLRNENKKLAQAFINFCSAILSEEIIVESIKLEREKASLQQRIKSLAPLLTSHLEKIAARKSVYQPKNYAKAEESFVKRYRTIKSMITLASLKGKKPNETEIQSFAKKLLSNFKNLSADEVKVLKEKGKEWINESITASKLNDAPEVQLCKSFVNFLDAVLDEEVVAETSNLLVEVIEIAFKEMSFEKLMKLKNPLEIAQYGVSFVPQIDRVLASRSDLKSRGSLLLVNLTNHLNRLAGEEEINSQPLSPAEEQVINQRIETARELSGTDNSNNTGSGLSGLAPNILLGGRFPNLELEKLDAKFGKVESPPKWYQNPWVICVSLIGAVVVGGLIAWLCLRRKESKREWEKY